MDGFDLGLNECSLGTLAQGSHLSTDHSDVGAVYPGDQWIGTLGSKLGGFLFGHRSESELFWSSFLGCSSDQYRELFA